MLLGGSPPADRLPRPLPAALPRCQAPPKEDWVLVMDPDMIVRDSFADLGRVYGAGAQRAASLRQGGGAARPACLLACPTCCRALAATRRPRLGSVCPFRLHARSVQQPVSLPCPRDCAAPGRVCRWAERQAGAGLWRPPHCIPCCQLPLLQASLGPCPMHACPQLPTRRLTRAARRPGVWAGSHAPRRPRRCGAPLAALQRGALERAGGVARCCRCAAAGAA